MKTALLDPFSGIAGDMTLGALLGVGLDPEWLRALPARLGLPEVTVRISEVIRGELVCWKVDFDIPPQPHGRHIGEIRSLVAATDAPPRVKAQSDAAFMAIAEAEGEIHGMPAEEVHLHEVGAVDAILDVVGSIWGLTQLGVEDVRCGLIRTGDGTVRAAHGLLPVPAPATLKLLEGHRVSPGPDGAGELVTPTGAALVKVLSTGELPPVWVPLASGFGAGTKDFPGRANALRIILAEVEAARPAIADEELVSVAADIDDMTGEFLADAADALRAAGALDVVLIPTLMKKGRPGVRIEVLASVADAPMLRQLLLARSTSIGVRTSSVRRLALPRTTSAVEVLGQRVQLKHVTLPDGTRRTKPEYEDVRAAALATGRSPADISTLALAAERV